eukprot:c14377_g1_i1.p1 GENE.c14377_g1_i1~~c14377_g1_i1.p1  ORF type:complete len:179 (-),score=16.97 c14377_g1_i1:28-564(-)
MVAICDTGAETSATGAGLLWNSWRMLFDRCLDSLVTCKRKVRAHWAKSIHCHLFPSWQQPRSETDGWLGRTAHAKDVCVTFEAFARAMPSELMYLECLDSVNRQQDFDEFILRPNAALLLWRQLQALALEFPDRDDDTVQRKRARDSDLGGSLEDFFEQEDLVTRDRSKKRLRQAVVQ